MATFELNIAIGYATMNPPGLFHDPYALGHGAHYRKVPMLSLSDQLAYIHTCHAESDTRAAQTRKLNQARTEHQRLYGDKLRRFRQNVRHQFNDFRPEHFHHIIANAPSKTAPPQNGFVT